MPLKQLSEITELADRAMRATIQRVGAHAVDRAIWHLGLGRHGTRLLGASLDDSANRWEAEVTGWKPSVIAEAVELIAFRALSRMFDIEGGEAIALESMFIRWVQPLATRTTNTRPSDGGKIFLEWSLAERESFRRDTLSNLTSGAVAHLTAHGCDANGLAIVEVELEVRASARRQISGERA